MTTPTQKVKYMKCKQCGKAFERKSYNQKFCSVSCKSKNHGYKQTYFNICEVCGSSFNPNRRNQRFCSRECGARGRGGPTQRHAELNAQCAHCGKQIYVQPKRLKNSKVYCDIKCMGAHRKTLMNGKDNPNFKNIPMKVCEGCGKEFRSYSSSRRYCSPTCSQTLSKNEALANTRRGLEAEKWCAKELVDRGYQAFLSAGSRGDFDVIGVSSDDIVLVQVKRTKSTQPARIFPKDAVIKLMGANYPAGGRIKKQLWCWVDPRQRWYIKDLL